MADYDWIKNLKVGDKVFVGDFLTTIERITPTGRMLVNGSYYNQRGRICGDHDPWSPGNYLREATPEKIEQYRKDMLVKRAHIMMDDAMRKRRLTYEQAVEIMNILEKDGEKYAKNP